MKKLAIWIISVSLLVPFAFASAQDDKWYSGGTLHSSLISEWKNSTDRNKLATSADFAMVVNEIKNKVKSSGDMNTLKIYAAQLKICIDEASEDQNSNNLTVADIGTACISLLGWR
ncbi:hypothetical protein [Yunchengibacter salinarum]|uniref:hypothetical protein n=1 Tax=Yunchengibacter salinarum TaxID=3133399 RepID=UPI0035B61C6D